MTHFTRVGLFAIALTFGVLGACSRGGDEETRTPVPASAEEPSPPGRLTISSATASGGSDTAAFAFDHDVQKMWNSGAFVPGWIQLDLGQPTAITKVRLYTAQTPAGATSHQILGGLTPDSLAPLAELNGETAGGQWLEVAVKGDVRYLRVATLKSPSWVAWGEIEVFQ